MKITTVLEASYHDQFDPTIIAEWLDMGLAGTGWLDDIDEHIENMQDDGMSEEDIRSEIKKLIMCFEFINKHLGKNYSASEQEIEDWLK